MLTSAQAKTILVHLGFRVNTATRYRQAIRDFQGGWNLGDPLEVDGHLGSRTSSALSLSESRRKAGKPTASAHFSFNEFACKCGGRYEGCRRIAGEGKAGADRHVLRWLIQSLEVLRTRYYPQGISIISGYRCPAYNKSVGGASTSQHLFGGAADVSQAATTNQVKNLKKFSGIGYQGSTGKVRHVDRRDTSGVNTTNATLSNPTVWKYS